MRLIVFGTLAAAAIASTFPAQAAPLQPPLPSPVELRAAVDSAIARGGLSTWHIKTLRAQASDLVRLETRYARDRYSPNEQAYIARRSRYLIKNLVGAMTKQPSAPSYGRGGPLPAMLGNVTIAYAHN